MIQGKNGKFSELARISDAGGRNQKIERVGIYFEGEDGKAVLQEVRNRVAKFEKDNNLGQ
jgi:hypothetical protein